MYKSGIPDKLTHWACIETYDTFHVSSTRAEVSLIDGKLISFFAAPPEGGDCLCSPWAAKSFAY